MFKMNLVKMYDFESGWVASLLLQIIQIAWAVLCLAGLRLGLGVLPGAVVCESLCSMVGPWACGASHPDGPWVSCYWVYVGGGGGGVLLPLTTWCSPSLFYPAGVIEVSVFLWCVWPVAWFSLLGLRCPRLTQVADLNLHTLHTPHL